MGDGPLRLAMVAGEAEIGEDADGVGEQVDADAEGAHGVDLLGHLHGPEFAGDARRIAPGDHQ